MPQDEANTPRLVPVPPHPREEHLLRCETGIRHFGAQMSDVDVSSVSKDAPPRVPLTNTPPRVQPTNIPPMVQPTNVLPRVQKNAVASPRRTLTQVIPPNDNPPNPRWTPAIRCTCSTLIIIPANVEVPFHTPLSSTTLNLTETDKEDPVAHRYPLQFQVNCVVDVTTPLTLETNSVIEKGTNGILEYSHLVKGLDKSIWVKRCANDFGRLSQGVGTRMPNGSNIIFFILRSKVP